MRMCGLQSKELKAKQPEAINWSEWMKSKYPDKITEGLPWLISKDKRIAKLLACSYVGFMVAPCGIDAGLMKTATGPPAPPACLFRCGEFFTRPMMTFYHITEIACSARCAPAAPHRNLFKGRTRGRNLTYPRRGVGGLAEGRTFFIPGSLVFYT